jgi:hypothetical protein
LVPPLPLVLPLSVLLLLLAVLVALLPLLLLLLLLPLHICPSSLSLAGWLPHSITLRSITVHSITIAGASAVVVVAAAIVAATAHTPTLSPDPLSMCVHPVLTFSSVYSIRTCKTNISIL